MKNSFIMALLWCMTSSLAQTKSIPNSAITNDSLNENTILLKDVIVTGNSKTDPCVTIVKSDFAEKVVQPKNSGELFSDFNGFGLIKRGNYAVEPSFRANQYEQLNVQYDGGTRAYHACPNRMDPITTLVNPEEISKIEVIKGPFSVRYGTTFAGIINMVTQFGNTSSKGFGGSISTGFESNSEALVSIVQLSNSWEKFVIAGDLSYRDYGNYKDGNQNSIPSSFNSRGYGVKMGYRFSENEKIQFNLRQNFGRDVLHAGLPMDTDEDNSSIGSLEYSFKTDAKFYKGIMAKVYYSFVDHIMSNYNRPSFDRSEAIAKVNATTFGGKLETEWDFSQKWKLFAGVDMVHLSRDGGRDRLVKKNMAGAILPKPVAYYDKIWQDSYTSTIGTFAEAKWYLSEQSILNFGARMDFVTTNARDLDESFVKLYPDVQKRNEYNFSGTISYKRMLSPNYVLELAFGSGTRSASIEERFIAYFNIGRDPYEYIGNPNLKAETNNQFEIGFTGKEYFKGFVQQLSFGGSVYYSLFNNYILAVVDESLVRKYNPTTPPIHPKVFRNINHAFKTGFEFYGDLKFADNFNFVTELAYVYTENQDFNESLPLTPPWVTRFKLGYEIGKFWSQLQYVLTAKQSKIAKSYDEISTQGYEVMDVKVGYKLGRNINIGASVLNLFDQYYNNHLTFAFNNQSSFSRTPITEPGRNFTLFLNYKF